jgi:hypothetical protein
VQLISALTKEVDGKLADTMRDSTKAAAELDFTVDSELRNKVLTGIAKLQKGLLERETEVSSASISAVPLSVPLSVALSVPPTSTRSPVATA